MSQSLTMEVELVWDYDNLVAVFAVSAYPEQNLHRTNMLDLLPINVVDDIIAEALEGHRHQPVRKGVEIWCDTGEEVLS